MASLGVSLVSRVAAPAVRRFTTSSTLRSQNWQQKGIPGSNLPFNIHNRYTLTALFIVFFGSALNAPFLLVHHQLMKK